MFAAAADAARPGGNGQPAAAPVPLPGGCPGVPSPEAGIKLLEDILRRVRNEPQIAMARQGLKYQNEQNALNAQQGPTDYRLAIRPREEANTPAAASKDYVLSYSGGYGGAGGGAAVNDRRGFWERGSGQPEKASAQLPAAASGPSTAREGQPVPGAPNPLGIWEKQQADAESIASRLSPESRARMTGAAGKLYRLAELASAVQSAGAARAPAARRQDAAKATTVAVVPASAPKVQSWPFGAPADSLSRPRVQTAGKVGHAPFSAPADVPGEPRAQEAAPCPPAVQEHAAGESWRQPAPAKKSRRAVEVALLPPNVVTGIPLVRLGSSEATARRALATMGSARQQVVSRWTVWSLPRRGSKSTALQVYMRNGLVEALRIFDNSLVGPEFGVLLGDDVSSVKMRFGEPTFILSEPMSGSGQNYVYPLSQVAFQLSRPASGKRPVVVSLLIFNVK